MKRPVDPERAARIEANRLAAEPTPDQAAAIARRREWTIAGYRRGGRDRYLTDARWFAELPRTSYEFRGLGGLEGKRLTMTFKRPLDGLKPPDGTD